MYNLSRFYVTSIEYNKIAEAENRTVPFAFDSLDAAKKKFYYILSQNIGNPSLGWCNVILWDCFGNVIQKEFWMEEQKEEPEEMPEEIPQELPQEGQPQEEPDAE